MDNDYHEHMKNIIRIMSVSIGERKLMGYFLDKPEKDPSVKSIGFVDEINSEYRNEFFKEIYEDENGFIIDVRFFDTHPSGEEMENIIGYWMKLHEKFKKPVKPVLIVNE